MEPRSDYADPSLAAPAYCAEEDQIIAAMVMKGRLREAVVLAAVSEVLAAQAAVQDGGPQDPNRFLGSASALFDASGGLKGPLGRGELLGREVEFHRRTTELMQALHREREARRLAEAGMRERAAAAAALTPAAVEDRIETRLGTLERRIQRGFLIAMAIFAPFALAAGSEGYLTLLAISAIGAGFVLGRKSDPAPDAGPAPASPGKP